MSALYAHHIETNPFGWGMTWSDARQRAAEEEERTTHETFFDEAVALKRAGNSESTPVSRSMQYLYSAACTISGGNFLQVSQAKRLMVMSVFLEAMYFLEDVSVRILKRPAPDDSRECRLFILALQMRAFCHYRIYILSDRNGTLQECFAEYVKEFPSILLNTEREAEPIAEEYPTSDEDVVSGDSGVGVSPAEDVEDEPGIQENVISSTQPVEVPLNAELKLKLQKHHKRVLELSRADDLWQQAEDLIAESRNRDFFHAAESGSASASVFTPVPAFVAYVRETLYRINEFWRRSQELEDEYIKQDGDQAQERDTEQDENMGQDEVIEQGRSGSPDEDIGHGDEIMQEDDPKHGTRQREDFEHEKLPEQDSDIDHEEETVQEEDMMPAKDTYQGEVLEYAEDIEP